MGASFDQTGNPLGFDNGPRIPASDPVCALLVNGAPTPFMHDPAIGSVSISGPLATGAGAPTIVEVNTTILTDLDADRDLDVFDFGIFAARFGQTCPRPGPHAFVR